MKAIYLSICLFSTYNAFNQTIEVPMTGASMEKYGGNVITTFDNRNLNQQQDRTVFYNETFDSLFALNGTNG